MITFRKKTHFLFSELGDLKFKAKPSYNLLQEEIKLIEI